jgi:hypothetical protein
VASAPLKRGINDVRDSDQQKRIAVGRRTHDCLGGNVTGSPRPVLYDELLPEPLRERLTDQARNCRHQPGAVVDPAQPPADMAILAISQGAAFLRWLAGLDAART